MTTQDLLAVQSAHDLTAKPFDDNLQIYRPLPWSPSRFINTLNQLEVFADVQKKLPKTPADQGGLRSDDDEGHAEVRQPQTG
jgi:hypothetical protein